MIRVKYADGSGMQNERRDEACRHNCTSDTQGNIPVAGITRKKDMILKWKLKEACKVA
jgi:hypothetical protein